MKLVSILNEEMVFTGIKGVSRSGIYTEMLKRAQNAMEKPIDVDRIVSGMIEREDTLQMPYDKVALPHLRLPELDDLYIIVGILPRPVQMQSVDPGPCQLVVMSLVSPDTADLYLKALAAMVRYLLLPGNYEKLIAANNAQEYLSILRADDIKVRNSLTAEDIVQRDKVTLRPEDTLSTALDLFSRMDRSLLPVIDKENKLIGELAAREILQRFIPEYIFRMDHLDFVNSFEPFSRIFKEEGDQVVRDYMSPASLIVRPDTPLIQFTVRMVKNNVRVCFVVDENGTYIGEIMLNDIVKKVLRG